MLRPVWSAIGVHREAEFATSHTPAFMRGEAPCKYVSVYLHVRSLEWYLLPDDERAEMLREHGMMGHSRPEVRANTVSAFALGDYEGLLAFTLARQTAAEQPELQTVVVRGVAGRTSTSL